MIWFFLKRKENILKLFELLKSHMWSYAIRCLLFWKNSRLLEEQMSWGAFGKQIKNPPRSILLSFALWQSHFLINFSPLKSDAAREGLRMKRELENAY